MKNILLFLTVSLFYSTSSYASLACSVNGTQIYFINGVNVDSSAQVIDSAKLINDILQPKKLSIDEKGNLKDVLGIYNYSTGLLNDIKKLREQLILDADGDVSSEKRREHFEELIKSEFNLSESMNWKGLSTGEQDKLGETLKKTFDYIYNEGEKNSLTYADDNFTKMQLYEDLKKLSGPIADLVAIAATDRQVVTEVKSKINTSLKANQKVIFVAHSQGNEALRTSYLELKNDLSTKPDELKKLESYFGTLHVAAPSPSNVFPNDKSQGIKLDTDLVISGSTLLTTSNIPVSPNYYYDADKTSNFWVKNIPLIGIFLDTLFTFVSTNFFHAFDDVYLNEKIAARSVASDSTTSDNMQSIFAKNVIKIASNLDDNCDGPDIDFTVSGSIRDILEPTVFNFTGFTNFNNKVTVTTFDKNDLDNSTTFNFSYLTYCSTCGTDGGLFEDKFVENVNTISDFSIPFSTAPFTLNSQPSSYVGEVFATNKFGKTSRKTFAVRVPQDKPPVVSLVSQECLPECGEGCGTASVPYNAWLNIQDSDSGGVSLQSPSGSYYFINAKDLQSDKVNFTLSNSGGNADPLTYIIKSSYLGVTNYTVPACSL